MIEEEKLPLVLVVEDNVDAAALVERWLSDEYQVLTLEDAEACFEELERSIPATVCLDLDLPGKSGIEALEMIRQKFPSLPVVILTANRDVETIVDAVQKGAYDYLAKPVDRTKLKTTVRNAVDRYSMGLRLAHLERQKDAPHYSGIIGESDAIARLLGELERVSSSEVTVLIQGESGTGKELVARAIHDGSSRHTGPFVAVNCAAIAENLLESEFFGHERGAFTGATSQRKGRLEQANGGTIFLDEVAELDLALQAKLLRALQEKRFHRVGGNHEIKSDFRVVAASHRDLGSRAAEGAFREDLYFRLAVFEMEIPPLRERTGDVEVLCRHFLNKLEGGSAISLTEGARVALNKYSFPGNVRELQNAMERAVVVCQDGKISSGDLPTRIHRAGERKDEALFGSKPSQDFSLGIPRSAPGRLEDMEKRALSRALEEAEGNIAHAARSLGIGRTTIYRKMKKFGIDSRNPLG